jgi:hypothetical protein
MKNQNKPERNFLNPVLSGSPAEALAKAGYFVINRH